MIALMLDNDWVYLDQFDTNIENIISKYFSARHPRIRFIDTGEQDWDGYYRKYDSRRQRIARPLLGELKKLCSKKNIPLTVIDERPPPKYTANKEDIRRDILGGITLEDHQLEALEAAYKNEIGLYAHTTGSGKTELMAAIAKMFKCPTVIIAEKRIIIEQIKERLELRDVVPEVGMFYCGSTPENQLIVVGSIQSLSTPPAKLKKHKKDKTIYQKRLKRARQFQSIVKKADLLMVDEADQATTAQYKRLFKYYFKGRRKYGFSGTPFEKSRAVENLVLKEHLGSIISSTNIRDLEKIGRIIPITFTMFAVGQDGDRQDKTAFDIAERELIIENRQLYGIIQKIINKFDGQGNLILLDTSAIEIFGKALEEFIPNSKFIYGKTSKSKRQKHIKEFEDRKLSCLIGGKIIKRGLDLHGGVDNLILLGGGKQHRDQIQKIGRALRNNDRGFARVISFMYLNNFYLYKHSREQLKAVVNAGYKTQIIFKGKTVSGEDLIKSRFRLIPKQSKKPKKRR